MNITLWIVQVLLSLHTAMGAVWKLSNSEQTVPSLQALPHGVWLALSGVELLCSVALLLPAAYAPLGRFVPIAALFIAAEMLLFTGLHFASGGEEHGQVVYWLVVAAICAFVAYGRLVLSPL